MSRQVWQVSIYKEGIIEIDTDEKFNMICWRKSRGSCSFELRQVNIIY